MDLKTLRILFIKNMEDNNNAQELLKQQENFEFYKKQVKEDYVDLNSEELELMYGKFCELGETHMSMNFGGKYHDFVDFVLKYSSDKDEYLEKKIVEYQNETDLEEEEEEEDDNYDDIYERK